MSCSSRYGKSAINSGMVRPLATASTIIPTVTRIPRMQGFPPMISGLMVMRRSACTLSSYRPSKQGYPSCKDSTDAVS